MPECRDASGRLAGTISHRGAQPPPTHAIFSVGYSLAVRNMNNENDPGDAIRKDPEAEFEALLARYAACGDVAERARLDDEMWERFGTDGAVFISDMSGFSRTTRALGISHFLSQIHEMRPIIARAVGDHGGVLLKAETDNCYAYFKEPDNALKASLQINAALAEYNRNRAGPDKMFISIGIDYGRLLLIGEVEFFGDPVNTASKLGEDLAARSEILLTRRAMDKVTIDLEKSPDKRQERISGIDIDYVAIDMATRS